LENPPELFRKMAIGNLAASIIISSEVLGFIPNQVET